MAGYEDELTLMCVARLRTTHSETCALGQISCMALGVLTYIGVMKLVLHAHGIDTLTGLVIRTYGL